MSGIFGIIYRDGHQNAVRNALHKMRLWNQAYGRDREEISFDNNAGLGCCYERLSVNIPPKTLVLTDNLKTAVIDALLYSHEILPPEQSDEEALLHIVTGGGFNALKNVNGDFSGAVYNRQDHTLTLFRDHMGIRPLFYYADNILTAFSTDIRALLALEDVDTSINEDWLYRTCSGYYMDSLEATEYKNIFCVPPASHIVFHLDRKSAKSPEKHNFWRPGSRKIRLSSFDAYKNRLRELVEDSIRIRLRTLAVSVGAELSGGLDSSVIDILIHRFGKECLYHSWSADPNQLSYAEGDERLIIRDICSQEGLTCHYSDLFTNYGMESNLAKQMQEIGIPLEENTRPVLRYAMPPYINTLTLSGTSEYMYRNGIKAVFTGHGGDEGVSHRCNAYELFYHHEYSRFFRQIWLSVQDRKHRPVQFLKKSRRILGSVRKQLLAPFCSGFSVPELLNRDFASGFQDKSMPALHFAYSPIEYIMEGGSRNRLDNVALQGAYNGVRYLVPYLDYRVIDFAVSIPRYLYLNGTQNRYLFREAFRDLMPDSLYHLQCKEDTSARNLPDNPDWFKEFLLRRDEVNRKLSRTLWADYLNFDFIDDWMKKGYPASEEEHQKDSTLLMCLLQCLMAQNATEKARKV